MLGDPCVHHEKVYLQDKYIISISVLFVELSYLFMVTTVCWTFEVIIAWMMLYCWVINVVLFEG